MKSTVEKYFWRGFIDEWSHITLFYQHAFTTDTENQTFLKWLFHKSMIFWIGLLYFVLGCFQYHPWWRLLLSFKTRNHGQASCRVHANHCWKVSLKSDLLTYYLVLHDYMHNTFTAIYASNHADLSVMFHCRAFILRAEFLPKDSQC